MKPRSNSFIRPAHFVAALAVSASPVAHAASETWGSTTTGIWSDGTQWVGAAAPGATTGLTNTDVATFSDAAGGTITIDSATQNIGGLLFSGTPGAYMIGSSGANAGNSLFLSSGGSITSGATGGGQPFTINAPLVLAPANPTTAGSYTFTSSQFSTQFTIAGNVTGGTTTQGITLNLDGPSVNRGGSLVSGAISDGAAAGGLAVTASGFGLWALSGNNTYTGVTNVSGRLNIRHGNALGGTTNGTIVTANALELDGAAAGPGITYAAEALSLTGTGQGGNGALRNIKNDNTWTGAITLAAAASIVSTANKLTIDVASGDAITAANQNLTLGGAGSGDVKDTIATGSGTLTKEGTGTWTLSGANTYTGRTTVTGGVLRLDNANALPGGVVTVGGTSSLLFNGAGSAGGVIGLTPTTGDFTRSIVGNNPGATQVGWTTGTTGGFAAFGGDRNVNFGGAAATIQWANGGGVFAAGLILGHSTSDSTITVVNPIDINTGNGRIVQVGDGSAAVDAILAGALTGINNAGNLSTLTKTGFGSFRISSANNTYIGNTIITQGTLQVGALGAISNGNGTGGGNVIFDVAANTALLDLNGFDSTINGLSQIDASTTNKVVNNATGTNKTLTVGNLNATSTFAGVIADNTSGTGTLVLTKIGTGTVTLAGTNSYTGATTVTQGTLSLGDGTTNTSLANASAVVIGTDLTAILDLNYSGTDTVATLTINGVAKGVGIWGSSTSGAPNTDPKLTGTGTLTVTSSGGSPYTTWAGGAAFDADANGDGVDNGLAWILGAANPSANALALLPVPGQSGGNLTLTFNQVNPMAPAKLFVEYSNDLGISDPWHSVEVPASSSTVSDVIFTVTPGSPTSNVTLTVPASKTGGGKLFSRLRSSDN